MLLVVRLKRLIVVLSFFEEHDLDVVSARNLYGRVAPTVLAMIVYILYVSSWYGP
jgi:hypothetical protein